MSKVYSAVLEPVVYQLVALGTEQHEILDVVDRRRPATARSPPPRAAFAERNDVGGLREVPFRERERVAEEILVVPVELAAAAGADG